MVYCNHSSLVILVNDAKYIHFYSTYQFPSSLSHCKYKPFIKSIKFCLFCYKYWLKHLPAIYQLILMMMSYNYLQMCSGRESIFTGLAAIFVYFCFCSQQVPYCSLRVRHARMLYPVAIYTIPLLGQRLQIAPMLCVPFTLGLVTCHPPGGSSHRFMLFLPTLCPLHSTCS